MKKNLHDMHFQRYVQLKSELEKRGTYSTVNLSLSKKSLQPLATSKFHLVESSANLKGTFIEQPTVGIGELERLILIS